MLKLAVNGWSYEHKFMNDRWTNEAFMREVAALPVDGMELNGRYIHDMASGNLISLRRLALDLNVPIASSTVFNDFGKPDLELERANVRAAIDACNLLGTSRLRVFAGWPKEDRERQWDGMIASLRESADYAAERGVLLMLENHNHGGFVRTGDDALRVLDGVASDWLKLLVDPGNFIDGLRSVDLVKEHAAWLHLKLWRLGEDGREPDVDYSRVMDMLMEAGFDGYCSIEYEPKDRSHEIEDVRRAVGYFRRLIDDKNRTVV